MTDWNVEPSLQHRATTRVPAYAWDEWTAAARGASERARLSRWVTAVAVSVLLMVGGVAVLPPDARWSVLLYAPAAGWGAGVLVASAARRRGTARAAKDARAALTPTWPRGWGRKALDDVLLTGRRTESPIMVWTVVDRGVVEVHTDTLHLRGVDPSWGGSGSAAGDLAGGGDVGGGADGGGGGG